jgi:hypothetical protein
MQSLSKSEAKPKVAKVKKIPVNVKDRKPVTGRVI